MNADSMPPVRRWRAFTVLAVAYFTTIVDLTTVNVSLPTIGRARHFSESNLQWVLTACACAFGGMGDIRELTRLNRMQRRSSRRVRLLWRRRPRPGWEAPPLGRREAADGVVDRQVALSLMTEFENRTVLRPSDFRGAGLTTMFDQVIAWSQALAPLRAPAARL